jgi:amphi-Trp domain-containing protein
MTEKIQKDFQLEEDEAADLLRDIADALESEDQLNIDLGNSQVVQPLAGRIPLRIYQDENGTELGFLLQAEDEE